MCIKATDLSDSEKIGECSMSVKDPERVESELKKAMVRITNPYKYEIWSEIQAVSLENTATNRFDCIRSDKQTGTFERHCNQVIKSMGSLKFSKGVIRNSGSPKVSDGNYGDGGIVVRQKRRKDPSLLTEDNIEMLSGITGSLGLKEFTEYVDECLKKGIRITGLSKILSDQNFLKSCYFEIRKNSGASTLGLDKKGLDGIDEI